MGCLHILFYFETGTSRDNDMNSTKSAEISRNVVPPHAYQYLILFFTMELSKAKYTTRVIVFTEKPEKALFNYKIPCHSS